MTIQKELFLATMFSGRGHAAEGSGLLIATSSDGIHFRNISDSSNPLYLPEGGVRDPSVIYWHGAWYLVYSYGPNRSSLLFLAQSSDLLHWDPIGSLRLKTDTVNNFIDVPQWIIDPSGQLHLVACTDEDHHWVAIHPLSSDPVTWGDQAGWSAVTTIVDKDGAALVQGNSFVALRNGTYYMGFNDTNASVYYMRTSTSLTSGWSAARQLNLDTSLNGGDSENLAFLANDGLRFYISNGNPLRSLIWYVDSLDLGMSWTSPKTVRFEGFGAQPVNWAQFIRITGRVAQICNDEFQQFQDRVSQ